MKTRNASLDKTMSGASNGAATSTLTDAECMEKFNAMSQEEKAEVMIKATRPSRVGIHALEPEFDRSRKV